MQQIETIEQVYTYIYKIQLILYILNKFHRKSIFKKKKKKVKSTIIIQIYA